MITILLDVRLYLDLDFFVAREFPLYFQSEYQWHGSVSLFFQFVSPLFVLRCFRIRTHPSQRSPPAVTDLTQLHDTYGYYEIYRYDEEDVPEEEAGRNEEPEIDPDEDEQQECECDDEQQDGEQQECE